jgi:hypothetical protein
MFSGALGATKGHICLQMGCAKYQKACPDDVIYAEEITLTVGGESPTEEKLGDTVQDCELLVNVNAGLKLTHLRRVLRGLPDGCDPRTPDRKVAFKRDLCDGAHLVHRWYTDA